MTDPTTYATDREAVEAAAREAMRRIIPGGRGFAESVRTAIIAAEMIKHLARVVPAKVGDGNEEQMRILHSRNSTALYTSSDRASEAEALLREVVNYVHHAPGCKSNDNWSDGFRAPPCDCPLGPLLAKARGFLGRGGG
jgi:hypothetical protein